MLQQPRDIELSGPSRAKVSEQRPKRSLRVRAYLNGYQTNAIHDDCVEEVEHNSNPGSDIANCPFKAKTIH